MNQNPIPCKVVVIGESGVGKTSIITRYMNNTYYSNFIPTMGNCYASKIIDFQEKDKKIKFEIWDTAGQEKYRSMAKIFYKDANAVIFVFDITRRTSFDEIKNYWYQQIKDNSPKNLIISIAGNKSDMYEYEEIKKEEAVTYAKSIGASYHETSAKNSVGIDELFYLIGLNLLDPELKNKRDSEDIKFDLKLRNNKIVLNKETIKETKEEKKRCCK